MLRSGDACTAAHVQAVPKRQQIHKMRPRLTQLLRRALRTAHAWQQQLKQLANPCQASATHVA